MESAIWVLAAAVVALLVFLALALRELGHLERRLREEQKAAADVARDADEQARLFETERAGLLRENSELRRSIDLKDRLMQAYDATSNPAGRHRKTNPF